MKNFPCQNLVLILVEEVGYLVQKDQKALCRFEVFSKIFILWITNMHGPGCLYLEFTIRFGGSGVFEDGVKYLGNERKKKASIRKLPPELVLTEITDRFDDFCSIFPPEGKPLLLVSLLKILRTGVSSPLSPCFLTYLTISWQSKPSLGLGPIALKKAFPR